MLRCLNSCFRFIDCRYEIIIIDNGCEEACKYLVEEFSNRTGIPVTYYCSGNNLGVSEGRNRGAELAASNVVFFIDDDAWIVDIKKPFSSIVKEMHDNPRVQIFSNPVYNSNFDVWMRPPTYNDGRHVFFFCGASHFVFLDRLPHRNLYPSILFYGHEDLNLSLDVWALDGVIGWAEELTVWHSTGGKRGKYEDERFYAIGNKYAVRAAHFPSSYQLRLLMGLISRCLKFWKGNWKMCIICIHYGITTKRKLKPLVYQLSSEQSSVLINTFGKEVLTGISHSGTDAQPPSLKNNYEP